MLVSEKRRGHTTVAHLNKQWQKSLKMSHASTPGQTHTHITNKHTHGTEQQTVATVSLSKKDIGKEWGRGKGGGVMG